MLYDLVRKTRSFRRFHEAEPVSHGTLRDLVDMARLGGTARNVQPLKYILINNPAMNAKIFPLLTWAGYLEDWPGPPEGERPAAYIVCLLDTRLSTAADCDLGIATQNILLGATEKGLGGCRIASFSSGLKDVLAVAAHLEVLMVVALGKTVEKISLEEVQPDGNIKYWRDADRVHHVPKRSLTEIIAAEITL
jgi:nitroreductase